MKSFVGISSLRLKAYLVHVFENANNSTIQVLFENYSYYLNLVFFRRKQKKLRTKHVLHIFFVLIIFENRKQFSKFVIEPIEPLVYANTS